MSTVLGGYFWSGPISSVPAERLTHLFYAFATIADGRLVLPAAAPADLEYLRREYPHLKVLLSIGGWGAGGFSDAALTPASRAAFAGECLAAAAPFDGVDLDWEFPVSGGPAEVVHRPEDRRNATLLARELRERLGPDRLLTAALPAARRQSAGPYDPAESYELAEFAAPLDFVCLMTYDFGTVFSPVAAFNAPLPEIAEAVEHYERHGVPRAKLVLGVPFYGRGFRVEPPGPGRPHEGAVEVGDYRDIARDLLPDPAWTRRYDPVARSPWLYHAATRTFVSYEDAASIAERARYAADHGLRGVFTWHLTGDDDAHSLLDAMVGPLR